MGITQSPYNIIKGAVFTERSTGLKDENRYVFNVAVEANKVSIRRAIEQIYSVHVEEVNTLVRQGKKRRLRYQLGRTPRSKRAIVRIRAGERIDLI